MIRIQSESLVGKAQELGRSLREYEKFESDQKDQTSDSEILLEEDLLRGLGPNDGRIEDSYRNSPRSRLGTQRTEQYMEIAEICESLQDRNRY